jgi:predicted nucleotidyltransferase
MTATWLDLKRPLDPGLDRLLRDLDEQLQRRSIPYLLTGAMAREILLVYGHGCAPGRATTDVDFGVTVPSWDGYEALRQGLTTSGRFRPDPKETQRMIHRNPETGVEMKMDLVPFGSIAGTDGTLAWPPDGSHVMRVLGYRQALATAIHLRLDSTCWVPMASAPGLAIMKLVTWADRGEARLGRDAVDFIEVLRQYSFILTDQELYDDFPEAMDRYEFRVEPAAAWILGKQVADLVDERLREVITGTLRPESKVRMIDHSLKERGSLRPDVREAETALMLDAFEQGFLA